MKLSLNLNLPIWHYKVKIPISENQSKLCIHFFTNGKTNGKEIWLKIKAVNIITHHKIICMPFLYLFHSNFFIFKSPKFL